MGWTGGRQRTTWSSCGHRRANLPLTREVITFGANLPAGLVDRARLGPASARPAMSAGLSPPLPDELAGSLMLQPRHEQRHSTLLASGRVWKTHVPVNGCRRSGNHQLRFRSDPRTDVELENRALSAPNSPRILPARFESAENDGYQDPDLTDVRILNGTSSLVRSPNLLNDPTIRRHVVTVRDLAAPIRRTSIHWRTDRSRAGGHGEPPRPAGPSAVESNSCTWATHKPGSRTGGAGFSRRTGVIPELSSSCSPATSWTGETNEPTGTTSSCEPKRSSSGFR